MEAKQIMPPYRNGQGHVYIRMEKNLMEGKMLIPGTKEGIMYLDAPAHRRIIGAERAEAAVEFHDFLEVCREEDLDVIICPNGVIIVSDIDDIQGAGETIREAYFHYQVELENAE
jgi:hypothetical protein